MYTMVVVIVLELFKLDHQITDIPEEYVIKNVVADSADEPFDEEMR